MVKAASLITSICLICAFANAPVTVYKVSKGTVQFKSDAPLELIRASSDELAGLFDTDRQQFAFRVKIISFKGFNGSLQKEHFNENYMESNRYPYASFEGRVIEEADYSMNGTYNVRAKGNLVVHGVSQERIIKVTITVKDKTVGVLTNFTVLLADHNITIPKVVHEKLASEIRVQVNADLVTQ
jgi:polyisoprenoid-binding protein YceI